MSQTRYAVMFENGVIVTRTSNNPNFTHCRCIWDADTGEILSKGFTAGRVGQMQNENAAALAWHQERHPGRRLLHAVQEIQADERTEGT